jgi:Domain of unknown function (DUF3883)
MKLSPIKREHIIEAGAYIDYHGISDNFLSNNYYVELPNGNEYPFKFLTRVAYQLTEGNEGKWLDFQSNKIYRGHVEKELSFPIHYYKEGINFITKEDIKHFEEIGGEKYRKENEEDVRAAQLLKPLVYKVNIWAEKSLIENFIPRLDYRWQWSGTFKPYLWIRFYRSKSSEKVFFVLGATSDGGLYYKLDCLRSNYTKSGVLSIEVQNQFDKYLKETSYREVFISKGLLQKLDWNKLIEQTTRYFYKYATLYDELENLINPEVTGEIETARFIQVTPPSKTKTYLNKRRTYKGKVTDWSQKQTTSKLLGDAGENLVVEFEKLKLRNAGLNEKADLVSKVLDGRGFDILSFDGRENEIHIEVKTTTGKEDEPFYFSINEKEYLEEYPVNYFLYRLHEFKFNPERTKYFMLSGNDFLNKSEFNPTNFEVSIIN